MCGGFRRRRHCRALLAVGRGRRAGDEAGGRRRTSTARRGSPCPMSSSRDRPRQGRRPWSEAPAFHNGEGRHLPRPRPLLRPRLQRDRAGQPRGRPVDSRYPSASVILPTAWVLPAGQVRGCGRQHSRDAAVLLPPASKGTGRSSSHVSGRPRPRRLAHAVGKFKVQGKTDNPTWKIPESIRKEHIRSGATARKLDHGRRARQSARQVSHRAQPADVPDSRHGHSLGRRHAGEPRLHAALPRGHRAALSRSCRSARPASSSISR